MNLVTLNQNNNTLSMTSREIATLTDKEHKNVKRDIEAMLEQLELDRLNFERIYLDPLNRQQTEFTLDKDLTITLVSGYSTAIRFRIIKRWQELEEQVTAPALPTTYLEALKALVISEEEKEVIQQQLTIAAPKLEYYEQVLNQNELMTISEVAKKNGITAQELNKILISGGIYDKRTNGKTFKTDFIDKGYGKMITARTGHTQAKLTIKGEAWVTNVAMKTKIAKELLEARKAKSAKRNKPLKITDEVTEARSKHTNSIINKVDSLLVS